MLFCFCYKIILWFFHRISWVKHPISHGISHGTHLLLLLCYSSWVSHPISHGTRPAMLQFLSFTYHFTYHFTWYLTWGSFTHPPGISHDISHSDYLHVHFHSVVNIPTTMLFHMAFHISVKNMWKTMWSPCEIFTWISHAFHRVAPSSERKSPQRTE